MALSRFAVLGAVFSLIAGAALAQEGPIQLTTYDVDKVAEETKIRDLDAALDAAFATGDFVGLSVAVVAKGETKFLKTWGVVEEGGARVTPRTVFRIGSLSKGFAASLAGMAMAEGRLSPDDPATRFAPGLKLAGGAESALKLGHLLSHQTGLPPNAYDIAGLAVASAYGEPYGAALKEKIFDPLGMATASVDHDGLTRTGDFARPHVRSRVKGGGEDEFDPWRAVPVTEPYYRVPAAGGVNASILDMASWLKAQMGYAPAVLSPDVLDLIHAPRTMSPAENARIRTVSPRFHAAQYAFGWRLYNYEGAPVIAHAGTVEGYAAQIGWLPERDIGIVLLSNSRSKRLWRILPTFLDIELGLAREDWLALDQGGVKAGSN